MTHFFSKGMLVCDNKKLSKVKLHVYVNDKEFLLRKCIKKDLKYVYTCKDLIFVLTEGFGELQADVTNMKGNR